MILCLTILSLAFVQNYSETNDIFTIPAGKTVMATNYDSDTMDQVLYVFPQSEIQDYIDADCGTSSKQWFTDNDFQLHQPNVPSHGDDAFPVSTVENAFKEKWENFITSKSSASSADDLIFDPFFDHNFGMYVQDMTQNIERLQDQSNSGLDSYINYQFLKWDLINEIDNKKSFLSLLVYIPNTQIIYELITYYDEDIYNNYLTSELVINSELRCTFNGFQPWNYDDVVIPIRQGRAVSDIDINVNWYKEYLNARVVESGSTLVNGKEVEYSYIVLDDSKGLEIGFYKRSSDDTYGDMIQSDYENGLNAVHKELVVSPNCLYDRWFDNHYAINLENDAFITLYQKINPSTQRYILFRFLREDGDTNAQDFFDHYNSDYLFLINLLEPNGNSIEVVGYFKDETLLENTNSFQGTFCNKCTDSDITFDDNWINNGIALQQQQESRIEKEKKAMEQKFVLFTFIFIMVISFGLMIVTACKSKIKNQNFINDDENDELTPLNYGSFAFEV